MIALKKIRKKSDFFHQLDPPPPNDTSKMTNTIYDLHLNTA